MARQVMLSEAALDALRKVRTLMGFKSNSEAILWLCHELGLDVDKVVNSAFRELEYRIGQYTREIELIEVLRIVYLQICKPRAVRMSKDELKTFENLKAEVVQKLLSLHSYLSSLE